MAEDKGVGSQSNINDNLIRMKQIDDQLKALESQKQELSKKKETYLQSLKNVHPNFFSILRIYDGEDNNQANNTSSINSKEYSKKIKIDNSLIKSVQKAQTEIHLKELQIKREQLFENKLKKLRNIGKLPKNLSFESETSDRTASIKESSKIISENLFSAESTSFTSPDEDESKTCAFKSLSENHKTKKEHMKQNMNLPQQQILFSQSSISTFKENPFWKKAIEESNQLEQLSALTKGDIEKSKETHERKLEKSNIPQEQKSSEVEKKPQTDHYLEPFSFSLTDRSDREKNPKDSSLNKNSKDTLTQTLIVSPLQDSMNFSEPFQSIPQQNYNYFYSHQNLPNQQLQQTLSYPLQPPNLQFVPPNFPAFNNSHFPPPFYNPQQTFSYVRNPYYQNNFPTSYADSLFGVPPNPLLFQTHPSHISKTQPAFNSGHYSEEDAISVSKKLINKNKFYNPSNGAFRKKYRSQKERLLSQSSDDNFFKTYDSKKPQKSMTIFENATVKCLFKLFELLENCQINGPNNKKSKKVCNTESWYRDATPSHTLKKDINATILTKGIKPDRVSYATLSMVALGHLKEIVARLPGSCLLDDNVISDHYRTFEELSKALEKPKRDLWDRITEHMKFLLEKKVMTLKKLVSTFLLILLHPQSEKAVKAENMLIRLFRTGLTKKQMEEPRMDTTNEINNAKEDICVKEEKNKKAVDFEQRINTNVAGSQNNEMNKINEKTELSEKKAVPHSSAATLTHESKADVKLNDEIISVIISTSDKDTNILWEEEGYKEIFFSEDMGRFTSSEMTLESNDGKHAQYNYNFNRPFFIDSQQNTKLDGSQTQKLNNETGNPSKSRKYNDKLKNEDPNENNVNSNEANLNLQPRQSSSPVSSLKEFSPLKENHRYKTLVSSHSFPIESASSDDEIEKQYKNMTLTSSLATTDLNELKQAISSKDSLDTKTAYISSFSSYKIQNGSLKMPSPPPNTANQTPMSFSIEKYPTMELTGEQTEKSPQKNGRVAHTSIDINKLINNESEDDSW